MVVTQLVAREVSPPLLLNKLQSLIKCCVSDAPFQKSAQYLLHLISNPDSCFEKPSRCAEPTSRGHLAVLRPRQLLLA